MAIYGGGKGIGKAKEIIMLRKRVLGIPILALVVILMVPLAIAMAYTIVTIIGTYQVTEPVTVSPSSWTVGAPGNLFYAGETSTKNVTLSNAASVPIEVDLAETITGPTPDKLTVTFTKKLIVPATGTLIATVIIQASKSITPGEYIVSISVVR